MSAQGRRMNGFRSRIEVLNLCRHPLIKADHKSLEFVGFHKNSRLRNHTDGLYIVLYTDTLPLTKVPLAADEPPTTTAVYFTVVAIETVRLPKLPHFLFLHCV